MRPSSFQRSNIADVRDGAAATLRGTVRRAGERVLQAPLSGRACVYWEVNEGVGSDAPAEVEGVAFWIEDATGRALVRPEQIDVAARGERRSEAIKIVDANIKQVSQRIRQLKRERNNAAGPRAKELYAEYDELRRLATLLCAIGAHARGNVHIGGDRDGQEAYIRRHAPRFDDGSTRALTLMSERYEVILEDGAEVEISGLCVLEPVPPGLGHGGGYRDAPTCLHVHAPAGGQLIVRGVGETAPIETADGSKRDGHDGTDERPAEARSWWQRVTGWFSS